MISRFSRPAAFFKRLPPQCVICQQYSVGEISPILAGHVCYRCLESKSYETANTQQVGLSDGLPMFSIEFEVAAEKVCFDEWQRTLQLLKHGFIRTKDSTVDDEYKSPIYRSLDAFLPVLPLLEQLRECVTNRCGTHIHVDCPHKEQLYDCKWEVFSLLENYIESHLEEAQAFWGRTRAWSWFNTDTRYDTIEFRLPCFRTVEQYLAVVWFCRRAGRLINGYLSSLQPLYSPGQSRIGDNLLVLYCQAVTRLRAKAS